MPYKSNDCQLTKEDYRILAKAEIKLQRRRILQLEQEIEQAKRRISDAIDILLALEVK